MTQPEKLYEQTMIDTVVSKH